MEHTFKLEEINREMSDGLSMADVEMAKLNLTKVINNRFYGIISKANSEDPTAFKTELLDFTKAAMDFGALDLVAMSMESIECKNKEDK